MPFKPPQIVGPKVILPTAENDFQIDVTPARLDVGDTGEIPKAKTKPQAAAPETPAPSQELSSSNSIEDLGDENQLRKLFRRTTVDVGVDANLRRLFRNTTKF